MTYPTWLYHRTEPARIVRSEDEHRQLEAESPGWADTPAAFYAPAATETKGKKRK